MGKLFSFFLILESCEIFSNVSCNMIIRSIFWIGETRTSAIYSDTFYNSKFHTTSICDAVISRNISSLHLISVLSLHWDWKHWSFATPFRYLISLPPSYLFPRTQRWSEVSRLQVCIQVPARVTVMGPLASKRDRLDRSKLIDLFT